jgi:CBS domain-containing protein/sporulation protein YlmC with PRC-barrel domain
MLYLSQLLGKSVYFQKKKFGKIIDMAVFERSKHPPIAKVEIKKGKKKVTISPHVLQFADNTFNLISTQTPFLPYDNQDFYLGEDLLDKQVIDLKGRRLVRVNDIALELNGEIKVIGIDIGLTGVLRRLGMNIFQEYADIIPWESIEAFDYETGAIKIKTTEGKLNSLHPSEIADILEDVGVKERLGIVAALDAKKAARAIEESNSQTQISILEDVQPSKFKDVLNKMHVASLVDVLRYLNPLRKSQIQLIIGEEKTNRLKKLMKFPDDVAGGLMHPTFFSVKSEKTVKEVIKRLMLESNPPETIIVTDANERLIGITYTKDLVVKDSLALMRDVVRSKKFIYPNLSFADIFKLFSEYNLRCLPVVDKEKKPIGIVVIDDVLKMIEGQKDESI